MCISKILQTLTHFPLANVETRYSRQLHSVKKIKVKKIRNTYNILRIAHSRPKHVQKGNKHIKKNFEPRWLYVHDFTYH